MDILGLRSLETDPHVWVLGTSLVRMHSPPELDKKLLSPSASIGWYLLASGGYLRLAGLLSHLAPGTRATKAFLWCMATRSEFHSLLGPPNPVMRTVRRITAALVSE